MEIERTESTRLEINISKKKLREYMEKQRGAYAGMFEKLTKSDVTPWYIGNKCDILLVYPEIIKT